MSVLGLLMSILLWAGAFITVGSEWFAMWQSAKWNGEDPALRNFMVSGIALALVLIVGKDDDLAIDQERSENARSG